MRQDLLPDFPPRGAALVCLALVLAILVIYTPSLHHGFAGLDDEQYVTGNPQVRAGLSLQGMVWAFAFNDQAYWHPLTWLSHMLDCEIFGLDPRGHHASNLLLHMANTLLLFLVLRRLTGSPWRSAAVAALFALHPLNVESVAWVASRKNLLSTLFWMLALLAYCRYAARPGFAAYLAVFLCLLLGLMAKPMLVTLPLVLLLLDYWPLGRLRPSPSLPRGGDAARHPGPAPSTPLHAILEKVPLMLLSAASVAVSILSAESRSILVPAESVHPALRVENALVSYITYLMKMFWPSDLAVFYPYPGSLPLWQTAGAGLLLLVLTFLLVRKTQKAPFLLVGWAWYLITLLPVIGLAQQGLWPAWADRFAYLPLIGPFILLSWGIPSRVSRRRPARISLAFFSLAAMLFLGLVSRHQVLYWGDNEKLFRHAVEVAPGNHLAHFNLAGLLLSQGRTDEAVFHYTEALRILPQNPLFHNGLGTALLSRKRIDKAVHHLQEAVRISPGYGEALTNLGSALRQQGKEKEAMDILHRALGIRPIPEAYHNLGLLMAGEGRLEEAVSYYQEALRLKPGDGKIHNDLAVAFYSLGAREKALSHASEALRLNPGDPRVRHNLQVIRERWEESLQGGESTKNP